MQKEPADTSSERELGEAVHRGDRRSDHRFVLFLTLSDCARNFVRV
jgi:hypothetical protein